MENIDHISAKSLSFFLIVTIVVLGITNGVQEAAPGQTLVDEITLSSVAEPGTVITTKVDTSELNLEPGKVIERTGIIHIHATGNWEATVVIDPDTDGYMTEYVPNSMSGNEVGYIKDGRRLKNSMKVRAEGYNEVDLAQGGVLIPHGSAGDIDIPIMFSQVVTFDDQPLPKGHVYHIVIQIVATNLPL